MEFLASIFHTLQSAIKGSEEECCKLVNNAGTKKYILQCEEYVV